jgi:hypothetical protein
MLGWAAACGSGTPVGGSFTVNFPTLADAVATDTVQVFVYPYSANMSCQSLFEARATSQSSPSSFTAQTATVTPCALNGGSGSLALPFGEYSFLAVAERKGTDFLIGCAAQTISDTNSVVNISLTLETNTESVPTTSCTTLSAFCSKKCM